MKSSSLVLACAAALTAPMSFAGETYCNASRYSGSPNDAANWADGRPADDQTDYLVDGHGLLSMGDAGKDATTTFVGRSLTVGTNNKLNAGVLFLGVNGTGKTSFPCGIDVYNAKSCSINITAGNTRLIDGEIRLYDDPATAPQFSAGTRSENQTLDFKGRIVGNANTGFCFFPNANDGYNVNTNDIVRFSGDLASFYGYIKIGSNKATQQVVLELGDGTFPGKADLAAGGQAFLRAAAPTAVAYVSNISFSAKSTLLVDVDITNNTAGCFKATDVLTVGDPVWVTVNPLQDPVVAACPAREYPILVAPEGVSLDIGKFRLNVINVTTGELRALFALKVADNGEGRSTLYVTKAFVESPIRDVVNATWTGAGADTAIGTAGNWKEGLPSFETGETLATFGEDGTEAVVSGLAHFNGLRFTQDSFTVSGATDEAKVRLYAQGIGLVENATATVGVPLEVYGSQTWTLGAGSILNLTAPLLSTIVSGLAYEATVTVDGAKDAAVTFSGSNGDFSGTYDFKKGPSVTLKGTNALGSADGTFKWTVSGDKTKKLTFDNAVEEKPIAIDCSADGNGNYLYFKGNNELKGAFAATGGTMRPSAERGARIVFSGGVTTTGSFCLNNDAEYVFTNKPMVVSMIQPDATKTTFACSGNVVANDFGLNFVWATANAHIRLLVPNCFDARTPLSMTSKNAGHVLDLCGNDQTFGHFSMTQNLPGAPQTDAVITNSGAAATLHIVQNREKQRASTDPMCWIGGDLCGPIDFWKDGSARIVVTNVIHAVGEIKITQGKFEFAPEASWRNATNVTVNGYETASNACLAVVDPRNLSRRATLNLRGAGTINVPSGVALRVRTLKIDGIEQDIGTWRHGATYSATAHTTPLITGGGAVEVCGGGLLLLVR